MTQSESKSKSKQFKNMKKGGMQQNLTEYDIICSLLNNEVNTLIEWKKNYETIRVPFSKEYLEEKINCNQRAKGDSPCLCGQYFKGKSYILNDGDFKMFTETFQKLLNQIVKNNLNPMFQQLKQHLLNSINGDIALLHSKVVNIQDKQLTKDQQLKQHIPMYSQLVIRLADIDLSYTTKHHIFNQHKLSTRYGNVIDPDCVFTLRNCQLGFVFFQASS